MKALVVGCNTATAKALPDFWKNCPVPIMGVIEPGVEAALADADADRIGIIATRGTIGSHAYQHALATRKRGLMIHGIATPLLVPLIEEDWISENVTKEVLRKYLEPLMEKGIDTLMLACTHYPLLIPLLTDILPRDVRLVDSATTCAEHLKKMLEQKDLLNPGEDEGKLDIYLTDLSEQFEELAKRFLRKPVGRVRRAVLGA